MTSGDKILGMKISEGDRVVFALSFARMGDAIGNSILIIVIPLLTAPLPAPRITETSRVRKQSPVCPMGSSAFGSPIRDEAPAARMTEATGRSRSAAGPP